MLAGSELQVLGVCGGAACWEHLGASVGMAAGGIGELRPERCWSQRLGENILGAHNERHIIAWGLWKEGAIVYLDI